MSCSTIPEINKCYFINPPTRSFPVSADQLTINPSDIIAHSSDNAGKFANTEETTYRKMITPDFFLGNQCCIPDTTWVQAILEKFSPYPSCYLYCVIARYPDITFPVIVSRSCIANSELSYYLEYVLETECCRSSEYLLKIGKMLVYLAMMWMVEDIPKDYLMMISHGFANFLIEQNYIHLLCLILGTFFDQFSKEYQNKIWEIVKIKLQSGHFNEDASMAEEIVAEFFDSGKYVSSKRSLHWTATLMKCERTLAYLEVSYE